MNEESSDDELPSISLSQDSFSKEVVMPSASELAAERAKELQTELELLRLREEHSPPASAPRLPPPLRSDSSGSEGETALAAAVRALKDLPTTTNANTGSYMPMSRCLITMLPAPSITIQHLGDVFADDVPNNILRKRIDKLIHPLAYALQSPSSHLTDDELILICGVACAACLAPPPSCRARRLLHKALSVADTHNTTDVTGRLLELLVAAATDDNTSPSVSALALSSMGDKCRGGTPLAERLAGLLDTNALNILLATDNAQLATQPITAVELSGLLSKSWRGLGTSSKHTALRLICRALATTNNNSAMANNSATPISATEKEAKAKILATLSQSPHHSDKQHPDYLKLAVATSTLQVLFQTPQQT